MERVNDDIARWREEIDRIDEQLLEAFNRRAHCAIEIGMLKRRLRLPIDVPEREAQIMARMAAANEGPLNAEAIGHLFDAVIGECRVAEAAMLDAQPAAS